jgi:hypothetical protein
MTIAARIGTRRYAPISAAQRQFDEYIVIDTNPFVIPSAIAKLGVNGRRLHSEVTAPSLELSLNVVPSPTAGSRTCESYSSLTSS